MRGADSLYRGILEERGKVVEESEAYEYAKDHLDEMPDKAAVCRVFLFRQLD